MTIDPSRLSCPLPIAEHDTILLGHGGGGRMMADLIERLFLPALDNPYLRSMNDQAVLPIGEGGGRLAFTTDAFVVRPLFFPGGDIGSLAVHGTVNDLAVGGARPLALAAAFILEEGLPTADLERIVASLGEAALRVGVPVVTGDTKVVERGRGDGLFVVTTGIGWVPAGVDLDPRRIASGDSILLSAPVGAHGVAVLSQREGLGFESDIRSDSAPLHDLVHAMLATGADVHALRDATRGGLAAVLCEMAAQAGVGIEIEETAVPVADSVRAACEVLGLDPMHVANEGVLVAFVAGRSTEPVLQAMQRHARGSSAVAIGRAVSDHPGLVLARTAIGGHRIVDRPLGEQLPRIC